MLKVSKKRYKVLFVACSSCPPPPPPPLPPPKSRLLVFKGLSRLCLLGGLLPSLDDCGDRSGDCSFILFRRSKDRLGLGVPPEGGRAEWFSMAS